MTAAASRFAPARQVADAVLYEGYVLYPYRASSQKNQVRWQFGVLTPRAWSEAEGSEPWCSQTDILLEPRGAAPVRLHLQVRCLQAQARTVEQAADCRGSGFRAVSALVVDGEELVTWDEGIEQEIEASFDLAALLETEREMAFTLRPGREMEPVLNAAGEQAGRIVRQRWPVEGVLRVSAERLAGPYDVVRLRARVENVTAWQEGPHPQPIFGENPHPQPLSRPDGRGEHFHDEPSLTETVLDVNTPLSLRTGRGAGGEGQRQASTAPPSQQPSRDAIVRRSLIAAHTIIAVEGGAFISLLEPPEWARPAVAVCDNVKTWPVLVGAADQRGLILSSPIILYDYPAIAPESQGDLFDATEIDEILTLRTMALTAAEKREARATDPRAAAIIDRIDDMSAELMDKLHGAIRYPRETPGSANGMPELAPESAAAHLPWWDPAADASVSPASDSVLVGGMAVARGSRVRLRPGTRGADAQDMFLIGQTAMVEGVFLDVDGSTHLAVTLEDDPGADLQRLQGRFRYFAPDEVEPLGDAP